jgi:hypothetical protein
MAAMQGKRWRPCRAWSRPRLRSTKSSEGRVGPTPEATRATLRRYREAYPYGRLAHEVGHKLAAPAATEAAVRADAAAWVEAERTGTAEAMRIYLAPHPDGENAG